MYSNLYLGSGVGVPLLVKQTISWNITLKELIGSGAFGNVYFGIFCGARDVAVKILSTNEEESWEHEKDLYLTTALPHTNILGYTTFYYKIRKILIFQTDNLSLNQHFFASRIYWC